MSAYIFSGGFDPLHVGHVRMFNSTPHNASKIVLLNSDEWLKRKKGYFVSPFAHRSEMLTAVGIDIVFPFNDDDGTAIDGLRQLRTRWPDIPLYFVNGGDRTITSTPELDALADLRITPIFGAGGDDKSDSSSDMIRRSRPIEYRPWGAFTTVATGNGYKVKELFVAAGQATSLQYHNRRDEYWVVVEGRGWWMNDHRRYHLEPGHVVRVNRGTKHRIGTDLGLTMIEVQCGDPDESDIVRLDDRYGRAV